MFTRPCWLTHPFIINHAIIKYLKLIEYVRVSRQYIGSVEYTPGLNWVLVVNI